MAVFDGEIYINFRGVSQMLGWTSCNLNVPTHPNISPWRGFGLQEFAWSHPPKSPATLRWEAMSQWEKLSQESQNGCGCTSGFLEFINIDFRCSGMIEILSSHPPKINTNPKPCVTLPRANFEAVPESPPGFVSANISAYKLAIKGHVCDLSFDAVVVNCNCLNLQISSFRLLGNSTLSGEWSNILNRFWTHTTRTKEYMHLHNALLYRLNLYTVHYCKNSKHSHWIYPNERVLISNLYP